MVSVRPDRSVPVRNIQPATQRPHESWWKRYPVKTTILP